MHFWNAGTISNQNLQFAKTSEKKSQGRKKKRRRKQRKKQRHSKYKGQRGTVRTGVTVCVCVCDCPIRTHEFSSFYLCHHCVMTARLRVFLTGREMRHFLSCLPYRISCQQMSGFCLHVKMLKCILEVYWIWLVCEQRILLFGGHKGTEGALAGRGQAVDSLLQISLSDEVFECGWIMTRCGGGWRS